MPFDDHKNESKELNKTDKYNISNDRDKDVIEGWYEQALHVTTETLQEFINHVTYDYVHTYDSYVHACTACGIAAVNVCGTELSGFQASTVAIMFPLRYYYNSKIGIRIINFDDFLYPQYEYKFNNTIRQKTWNLIQDEAKHLIEESTNDDWWVHPDVMKHWTSIVDGVVPFGYKIVEDD